MSPAKGFPEVVQGTKDTKAHKASVPSLGSGGHVSVSGDKFAAVGLRQEGRNVGAEESGFLPPLRIPFTPNSEQKVGRGYCRGWPCRPRALNRGPAVKGCQFGLSWICIIKIREVHGIFNWYKCICAYATCIFKLHNWALDKSHFLKHVTLCFRLSWRGFV